ncbi:TatD family hydrolase [Mycoplasmopsis agassizii]|uniref:TatD family hydrolase n=1 Tax=Mycoplasmopsis agassizii TaxID=33922 RepID=UPI003528A4CF
MSKLKFIDLHTHPYLEYYENPIEEVQSWIDTNELEMIFFTGVSFKEIEEIKTMKKAFPNFVQEVLGIHPMEVKGKDDTNKLTEFISEDTVAIGEVGLDYYYKENPSKEIQFESFIAHIEIAKARNLPVVIHSRDAFNDIFEIISREEYQDVKFIFHTFSGDSFEAERFLKHVKNIYFSFSGVITFKNNHALREACKIVPLDRIFCETDTPYLTPMPFRGKPNKSPYVKYVYEKVAEVKGIDLETLVKQVRKNVKDVFNI